MNKNKKATLGDKAAGKIAQLNSMQHQEQEVDVEVVESRKRWQRGLFTWCVVMMAGFLISEGLGKLGMSDAWRHGVLYFTGAEMIIGGIALAILRPTKVRVAAVKKKVEGQDVSTKSKSIALLLCICFGFLGLHNFYAGKKGLGVLYLCTLGLVGFGWIFDSCRIAHNIFTDSEGKNIVVD